MATSAHSQPPAPRDPRASTRQPRGSPRRQRASPREWLEYILLRLLVAVLKWLPRPVGRGVGAAIGALACHAVPRLRRIGLRNLTLAFPEKSDAERTRILRTLFRYLGWQMAEFCRMSRATSADAQRFFRYEGLEHFLAARARGKGVLVLTGHLGAWELSSFYHSLMGYPMSMVIRRLDNPLVDAFVNRIRCLHGNRVLHKDDFARGLLQSMHRGDTVGILMDTNMTPPQGVFVPFFGTPACTASGLARVAAHSNAAVLPGFMLWEPNAQTGSTGSLGSSGDPGSRGGDGSTGKRGRYVLHFGPELTLQRTADPTADALANTALFTATLESWIRRYPDQWLWVHRRWKTRPEGEESLYG